MYNKSYFEAARRLEKRSLLGVNEHFPDKADAERALLDDYSADLASGNFFYFTRTRPRKSVVICEIISKFAVSQGVILSALHI